MKKENKKSAMETANTTAQYKNPNTLYHENNEKGKMNINTAVFVLKNVLTRYDEQMEILENIKIVYQKTVIPNELYRDGNIEHVKKGSAIGMADELINYIEFKDRYILELDQKEIVGKLMIVDMRKGAKNE